ncbi:low-density lipoprotein receptor-like isoform X2 [Pteropus vampyrus]|uniref:Low-density lipoprotein receptor-like isoform X2 n=1 Tax=Pteropus vampyrus TaxID=132908 RepID=A0A6P6D336_PTEVA|nr:low-density lipoprotein receptor-like isoform X2 [Pteropus vampyrus]
MFSLVPSERTIQGKLSLPHWILACRRWHQLHSYQGFCISIPCVAHSYHTDLSENLDTSLGQATLPEHRILPVTTVNHLTSMDCLVQEKALYLSELDNGDIRQLRLKESGNLSWRRIISAEGTVIDLSVDWLSGNVYWIDSENPHISVASSEGRGLIESIQQDGSRYRVDCRGILGLNHFTYGKGMMFWTTIDDAQITKVWYSKAELSENQWF